MLASTEKEKTAAESAAWTTTGFEAFRRGSFGNAGQNLYVSRAGVLQRIHQYDLNGDGYFDIVLCNSQNHHERPPIYVYRNVVGAVECVELPSEGAWSGALADLNGDGYDDLVVGMKYNGIREDLNAFIYYGSAEGFSEKYHQQLPAPSCTSVAIGDFNGDGRLDIAFLCRDHVRVFFQSELGFDPQRFAVSELIAEQIGAHDIDKDGFCDLLVRRHSGEVIVYWGSKDGFDTNGISSIASAGLNDPGISSGEEEFQEYVPEPPPLVQAFELGGVCHIFVARPAKALLIPMKSRSVAGQPLQLDCKNAMAVAVGDINGNGFDDIIVACRDESDANERSWIFWGGAGGFNTRPPTPLPSHRACDVQTADLDGDGFDDIVLCQSKSRDSFTTESLIYRGCAKGIDPKPLRVVTHDARRVLIADKNDASGRPPQVVIVNHFARHITGKVPASIFFGGPDGFSSSRRHELPAWGAVESISCDINDDGYVDVILANACENAVSQDPGSFILLNGPRGFSERPDIILGTTRAHGVACADINRDGYLDLIFCGFNNSELLIFYGSSDGFSEKHMRRIRMHHDGEKFKEPRWIYLADLNNDGWLDLIVPQLGEDRSFVLWGGAAGFNMDRCQVLSPCLAMVPQGHQRNSHHNQ